VSLPVITSTLPDAFSNSPVSASTGPKIRSRSASSALPNDCNALAVPIRIFVAEYNGISTHDTTVNITVAIEMLISEYTGCKYSVPAPGPEYAPCVNIRKILHMKNSGLVTSQRHRRILNAPHDTLISTVYVAPLATSLLFQSDPAARYVMCRTQSPKAPANTSDTKTYICSSVLIPTVPPSMHTISR